MQIAYGVYRLIVERSRVTVDAARQVFLVGYVFGKDGNGIGIAFCQACPCYQPVIPGSKVKLHSIIVTAQGFALFGLLEHQLAVFVERIKGNGTHLRGKRIGKEHVIIVHKLYPILGFYGAIVVIVPNSMA